MNILNLVSCDIFIPTNTMIDLNINVDNAKQAVVSGIVKDNNDIPVKNAIVQLFNDDHMELEETIITDDDGIYTFIINNTNNKYTIKTCF